MPRNLKTPRVYSVEIHFRSGKILSVMLGVAFNNVERQRYYDRYRSYAWGSIQNVDRNSVVSVKWCGEKLT